MKKACFAVVLSVAFVMLLGPRRELRAEDTEPIGQSLQNEANRAIEIAFRWLKSKQDENGHWSNESYPALTALVVSAYFRSPALEDKSNPDPFIRKAMKFIESCVQDDGGIYIPVKGAKGGGLSNYNTAICAMALADADDRRYDDVIKNARRFLAQSQYLGSGDYHGGSGYDASTERPYADLSNTSQTIVSIRETEFIEFIGVEEGCDLTRVLEEGTNTLDWGACIEFLNRCQNLKKYNDAAWVNEDEKNKGGFVYSPTESKAGMMKIGEVEYLRSYGSMTYAGLLSFIYARVDKDDERVQAAYDWIRNHFALDENPGMGAQGLYYNYHTMAKALAVYGEDTLILPDGKSVRWRQELIKKLISLQKVEAETGNGYWVNDSGRWWENDPVLVTAYAILAMEEALGSGERRYILQNENTDGSASPRSTQR
jgi:squalene-hopene/tetraprenyl-beta-curcumene cyclase